MARKMALLTYAKEPFIIVLNLRTVYVYLARTQHKIRDRFLNSGFRFLTIGYPNRNNRRRAWL